MPDTAFYLPIIPFPQQSTRTETIFFASRNAPSNFLQPVLNVSRVWPRDLEPLGGDFDCAKDATLREKHNIHILFVRSPFSLKRPADKNSPRPSRPTVRVPVVILNNK